MEKISQVAMGAAVAGLIGLILIGLNVSREIESNNVSNLPALQTRVDNLEEKSENLRALIADNAQKARSDAELQRDFDNIRDLIKQQHEDIQTLERELYTLGKEVAAHGHELEQNGTVMR